MKDIIQILTGTLGALGFSMLFNVRGRKLLVATLGGCFSWTLCLLLARVTPNEFLHYFVSSCFVAVYAEVFARIMKTPATTFLIPSIIPHIPGSSLYHTMQYALTKQWNLFTYQAFYTLQLALGLALGIVAVLSVLSVGNKIGAAIKGRSKHHEADDS